MGLRNHVPATHSGQFEFSKVRFAETRVLVETGFPALVGGANASAALRNRSQPDQGGRNCCCV